MREVLCIHVGQCGNQIADQFWRLIAKEHGLNNRGVPIAEGGIPEDVNQGVFFHKVNDSKYVPRAVLVDLEPGVISRIEGSDMGDLFDQGSIVKKLPGAANNWARGYHVEGERIIDQVLNVVDAAMDKTESLHGFIITHRIGSGSGCGSLIVEKLREAYPKKIFTFSVAPSALISDSETEPYNSILSLQKLKENADAMILLDNEALSRITQSKLKRSPNYMDLNHMISLIMSSVTSSLRFHGTLNTDLGEFLVNLVPFPGNHFLTASFAPMTPTKPDGIVRTEFADSVLTRKRNVTPARFRADSTSEISYATSRRNQLRICQPVGVSASRADSAVARFKRQKRSARRGRLFVASYSESARPDDALARGWFSNRADDAGPWIRNTCADATAMGG